MEKLTNWREVAPAIRGMTTAELVALAKRCSDVETCGECPMLVDEPSLSLKDGCISIMLAELVVRVERLERKLKVARTERDAERARVTRLIGMAHKEWLEKVHPDWYERLEKLDYNYNPVKDGTPWYRAEDVWACIEEVAE